MITVHNTIHASIDKVWDCWTLPEHIKNWNVAIEDWYTQEVENDLKVGGKFNYKMAKKEGSLSFNFEGEYTKVENLSLIEYKLIDNRVGRVHFEKNESQVKITETFEPVKEDSESMQQQWCQTVVDNFKKYVEGV
ncbi:SRPBCC domain-containing protein [Flavobacterium aquidurense]|uniref:Activator of Hsp90 ATPase 1 family protein n=1 Tax=Flavobacterium aquidurense TaxID=362413 RepID=A0A0Q0RUD4_9FLAO|nr:SRPBCC domain-containing protein [Flavobacterium aquidurense]KQB40585.1 Activator of Hsp90 ATPase 1 family protein [Flavobacterium aquidurense]